MEQDMRKMQQDAIHRVNEMQSRAKKHLQEEPPRQTEEKERRPPQQPPAPQGEGMATSPPATLFDGLMQDSERTLILMLMLLLFTDNADTSVIFSLLYLIL